MLTEIQRLLNRIYTEEDLRQDFFKDRKSFLEKEGIRDAGCIDFLEKLKQEQVEFFAEGLYSKRIHSVSQLMPATVALLGPDHKACFKIFSKTYLPRGVHKHHNDALAYSNYLKQHGKNTAILQTILKFESDLVRNFIDPGNFRCSMYFHNPVHLRKNSELTRDTELKKKLTFIFWHKGKIKKVLCFA